MTNLSYSLISGKGTLLNSLFFQIKIHVWDEIYVCIWNERKKEENIISDYNNANTGNHHLVKVKFHGAYDWFYL